ncbi:hypothetical protein [Paenibacillus glacialis]|uniref:Uncharacterized protein n=1 Tax=Paenibacillus glacialis TaxID=494026 RepID=A0A162M2R1_9BACL|nr:hypothetical protein [Paenibacillus glacialis]OAB37593.1 hypothetical protein PGLA_20755 [Paenibacillus glacialis]
MKKILMISISACSSRAGNGDVAQTQNEDKTTEKLAEVKTTEKSAGEKQEGTKSNGGKKTIVFSTLYHYGLLKLRRNMKLSILISRLSLNIYSRIRSIPFWSNPSRCIQAF